MSWSVALKPLARDLLKANVDEWAAFEDIKLVDKSPDGETLKGIVAITKHIYDGCELAGKKNPPTDEIYDMFKQYAVKDNEFSRGVWEYITALPIWQEVQEVYAEEKAVIPVLCDIEQRGMSVNRQRIAEERDNAKQQIAAKINRIYSLAGTHFDIAAKDAGNYLRNAGVPINAKGKDGNYLTNKKVLAPWKTKYEIVELFLDTVSMQHDVSNFYEAWLRMSERDGLVRTYINSMGASHGRMSSERPNLMNVPKDAMRTLFEAPAGASFVSFDWSQIELVFAAFVSKDPLMSKHMREGTDMHLKTASVAFDKPEAEVTDKERKQAKIANFMIIYGGMINALKLYFMDTRKIGEAEAKEFAKKYYEDFFKTFPGLRQINDAIKDVLLTDELIVANLQALALRWKSDPQCVQCNGEGKLGYDAETGKIDFCPCVSDEGRRKAWGWAKYKRGTRSAKHRGYLRNIYGRIWKPDTPQFAYKGFEAVVSGAATGDLTKRKMVSVFKYLKDQNAKSHIALPIHDELLMVIYDDERHLIPAIKTIMEYEPRVTDYIPIRCDIEDFGPTWNFTGRALYTKGEWQDGTVELSGPEQAELTTRYCQDFTSRNDDNR